MSSEPRQWLFRIRHIINAIQQVQHFTSGATYDEFAANAMMVAAVARYIEIVGEASRYVPNELVNRDSSIPWRKMRAMRNVLIHEYERVNLQILWSTATEDLPALLPKLKALLEGEEASP
ncbi:MAG: DUF86 domain-containing protein [Chloroflexi bacterium]|nr:DUF86 domain-containing protein [Chloroflexota bacterium]